MQAVLEAVETYRHDLEEAAQALRHRGQSLAEDAPKMIEDTKSQIEPHTQELVNTVQDTRAESGDDSMIRMQLLSYAIIQGMLMGYVIDSIYLSYIPYAVITPAIVTVSFATVAKQSNGERKMLLGGTIGTAISVNFILGMITGSLSFVYFLLTLTYAGIAAVIMQLCLRNLKGTEDDSEHFYQNALSCSYVIAKVMFYLMFGSYHSDVQAQKQD
uniref:MFS transporter n=1 Tax=Haemonchus contortus TaxID=6289 RepID=A0A7I4Y4D0_HAECO